MFDKNLYLLQAGFVELLLYGFKGTIIFAALYIILTVSLQTFLLLLRWEQPIDYNWPGLLSALYIIQRFCK